MDGDMRRQLPEPLPEIYRTPMHLKWDEAHARGVGRAVWENNAAADATTRAPADARWLLEAFA